MLEGERTDRALGRAESGGGPAVVRSRLRHRQRRYPLSWYAPGPGGKRRGPPQVFKRLITPKLGGSRFQGSELPLGTSDQFDRGGNI